MTKAKHGPLAQAIQAAGGHSKLAAAIGVTPGAISQWRGIPAKRVMAIEAATGVPRHKLRPDIYQEGEE